VIANNDFTLPAEKLQKAVTPANSGNKNILRMIS
jgi:hypothetical protein